MSGRQLAQSHLRSFYLTAAAATDPGKVRAANEDAHALAEVGDALALVVCDGMGGHRGGQLASRTAAQAIVEALQARAALPEPQALFEALAEAHARVQAAARTEGVPGAGTTAAVALVRGDRGWVGWVGDSRVYHLRAGAVLERTVDHTRVQARVARGELRPEEASAQPDAHVLSRALGADEARPEVWNEPLELAPGDLLLLGSDGLYDPLPEAELHRLIEGLPAQAAAQRLVEEACARSGSDNATAVLMIHRADAVPRLGAPEALVVPAPRRVTTEVPAAPAAVATVPVPAAKGRAVPLWAAVLGAAVAFALGWAARGGH